MVLDVVSLSGRIFKNDAVAKVVVPSLEGELGILPGHISLITPLGIGVLKITLNSGATEDFLIYNGLLVVNNDQIEIMAENAAPKKDLSKAIVKQAIKDAEEKLASVLPPNELIELEKQLRFERFKEQQLTD